MSQTLQRNDEVTSSLPWSALRQQSTASTNEVGLLSAVKRREYSAVCRLLRQGSSPDSTSSLGEPAVYLAVANSDFGLVELLLRNGASANKAAAHGDTPLHLAVCRGYVGITALLLSHKASVGVTHPVSGQSPLHYAVIKNHLECVSILLRHGADPFLKDFKDQSSFDLASCKAKNLLSALTSIPEENSFEKTQPEVEVGLENKHLWMFLKEIRLEQYFECLCQAGFEDLASLIEQVQSPMPLTQEMLAKCGVIAPGHQRRLLAMLDALLAKKTVKLPVSKVSLKEWLTKLKLEAWYEPFVNAGFEDLESITVLMSTKHEVTDEVLKKEVGILKPGHRVRLLGKLLMEASQDISVCAYPLSCVDCALL